MPPVPWRCFTWIHGHLSFSAAVQALTRPFLLRRAKYGYHFCRPKRARWVDEAVICWLEIMPPSMPSGPEHSESGEGEKDRWTSRNMWNSVYGVHIGFKRMTKTTFCNVSDFVLCILFFSSMYPESRYPNLSQSQRQKPQSPLLVQYQTGSLKQTLFLYSLLLYLWAGLLLRPCR